MSLGNVVFNRIPLRFKGKPCNKLRYLPARREGYRLDRQRTIRMAYESWGGRIIRPARLRDCRRSLLHLTSRRSRPRRSGKRKYPRNPDENRCVRSQTESHTFHVAFPRRYSNLAEPPALSRFLRGSSFALNRNNDLL